MKTKSEPIWGGETAIKNMLASAEFMRTNREQQIAKILEELLPIHSAGGTVGRFWKKTPIEFLRGEIENSARTMRSWCAFGEPSPYGKAVCARLMEEIICYAAIKRALTR